MYGLFTQYMLVGSWFKGGGAYFKIENGDQPISLIIDRK